MVEMRTSHSGVRCPLKTDPLLGEADGAVAVPDLRADDVGANHCHRMPIAGANMLTLTLYGTLLT